MMFKHLYSLVICIAYARRYQCQIPSEEHAKIVILHFVKRFSYLGSSFFFPCFEEIVQKQILIFIKGNLLLNEMFQNRRRCFFPYNFVWYQESRHRLPKVSQKRVEILYERRKSEWQNLALCGFDKFSVIRGHTLLCVQQCVFGKLSLRFIRQNFSYNTEKFIKKFLRNKIHTKDFQAYAFDDVFHP